MDWFIKAFIRASLLWFAAGIVLGLAMAIHPAWVVYRPAHAHMNVAGFLTFLVFGVGYQLLPRLFGAPLYSRRMAIAHLYLANLGLAGLVFGFLTPRLGAGRRQSVGASTALGALALGRQPLADIQYGRRRQRMREQSGRQTPHRGSEVIPA
jgi:hypothetical protein